MQLHNSSGSTGGRRSLSNIAVSTLLILLFSCITTSCKKADIAPGSAHLTIVNTVPGSKPLATNFSSEGTVPYISARRLEYDVYFYLFNRFYAYSGSQRLRLFQYPDTTDKDVPLFDLQLDLPVGSINTLFLTGTLNDPDTVFTRDNIPFFPGTDSSMAIRFVNLSPGSEPISINIKGLANGSEVSNIAYKQITGFRKYAATTSTADYEFEFRNATTGALIASYIIPDISLPGDLVANQWRYRSFTMALTGEPGGTGSRAPAGFLVFHY